MGLQAEIDRASLKALFEGTAGSAWAVKTGWLEICGGGDPAARTKPHGLQVSGTARHRMLADGSGRVANLRFSPFSLHSSTNPAAR